MYNGYEKAKKQKREDMNSSEISNYGGATPSECAIYAFLGGKLDRSTTDAYALLVFIIVAGIIASPLTAGLNVLVMIAVKTKPRLKTMSNIALVCLAVTDGLMGVIGLPHFIACRLLMVLGATSSEFCTLQLISRNLLRILGGATVFHLVLMNVERYIAIKHSFKYTSMVTETRVLGSSAIAWIAILVLTVPFVILDEDIYLTVNNVSLFVSMTIIVFCQLTVYLATRRHERQIATHQVSMEERRKFLKEKKAFKLTTVVLVTQLMTYAPIFVVRLSVTNSIIRSKNVAYIAFYVAIFVLILNSMLNPIIYCVRTKQFRQAFIEILFRKRNTQVGDSSFCIQHASANQ